MFKVGQVYTHSRMLDVCMLVVAVNECTDGTNILVRWFKKNGLDLQALDSVFVHERDYKRWGECSVE